MLTIYYFVLRGKRKVIVVASNGYALCEWKYLLIILFYYQKTKILLVL